jgi:hypothetical protein
MSREKGRKPITAKFSAKCWWGIHAATYERSVVGMTTTELIEWIGCRFADAQREGRLGEVVNRIEEILDNGCEQGGAKLS